MHCSMTHLPRGCPAEGSKVKAVVLLVMHPSHDHGIIVILHQPALHTARS